MNVHFRNILNRGEETFEQIRDFNEKKKEKIYSELNENLILLAEVLTPMIAKMILSKQVNKKSLFVKGDKTN